MASFLVLLLDQQIATPLVDLYQSGKFKEVFSVFSVLPFGCFTCSLLLA